MTTKQLLLEGKSAVWQTLDINRVRLEISGFENTPKPINLLIKKSVNPNLPPKGNANYHWGINE